ncbi:MAG: YchJ family protein [Spongiibacter sp.]|nr:YchJ family protein [Spongiibacter sp.]
MPGLCPCGSGADYSTCCGRFHKGEWAPCPEQLMRSRYSAYVVGDADYLYHTWHPSARGEETLDQFRRSFGKNNWLGLRILRAEQVKGRDLVEFAAFYRDDRGKLAQLHEESVFVEEGGQWYYLEGRFLPDLKLGRNDACYCGSGQKRKKCHPD